MKPNLLIIIAFLLTQSLRAQTLILKKEIISEIKFSNDGSNKLRLQQFDQQAKLGNEIESRMRSTVGNRESSYQNIIHDFNGTRILVKHSSNKSQLLKYSNGALISSKDLTPYQNAYSVDSNGTMIIGTHAEGGITTGFTFLSSSLIPLSTYVPYEFGSSDFQIGSSDKFVCIYSTEEIPPKKYKLALLNFTGKEIILKEFDSHSLYGVFCIKVSENKIFVLYTSFIGKGSKIVAFDSSLSQIWEWKSDKVISGNQIEIDKNSNSLFGTTQEHFFCIDLENGAIKWKKPIDGSYKESDRSKIFSYSFCLKGKYVAIITSQLINYKSSDCSLLILDQENGNDVYNEKLGDFTLNPQVFGKDNGFVILTDDQILNYSNE